MLSKSFRTCAGLFALSFLGISARAQGPMALSDLERSQLREKLTSAWSDLDLMVRNQKIDQKDLERQEREMREMRIFDKIPLGSCQASLRASVARSASQHGLDLRGLAVLSESPRGPRIPRRIYAGAGHFRLMPDQVVEKLQIRLRVRGLESSLRDWAATWKSAPEPVPAGEEAPVATEPSPPLLEPFQPGPSPAWRAVSGNPSGVRTWSTEVAAYCFRDIRFPKLAPLDPVELLPPWARKNPERFSREEPRLWSLVERGRDLIPQAVPLFATRERFLLNDARFSFFLRRLGQVGSR